MYVVWSFSVSLFIYVFRGSLFRYLAVVRYLFLDLFRSSVLSVRFFMFEFVEFVLDFFICFRYFHMICVCV